MKELDGTLLKLAVIVIQQRKEMFTLFNLLAFELKIKLTDFFKIYQKAVKNNVNLVHYINYKLLAFYVVGFNSIRQFKIIKLSD